MSDFNTEVASLELVHVPHEVIPSKVQRHALHGSIALHEISLGDRGSTYITNGYNSVESLHTIFRPNWLETLTDLSSPKLLPLPSITEISGLVKASYGLTTSEIEKTEFWAASTIRSRQGHIVKRLGTRTLQQAIYVGFQCGLLDFKKAPTDRLDYCGGLKSRELEMLYDICLGRQVSDSAGESNITRRTVKAHRCSLFYKLDVLCPNGTAAASLSVRRAFELGILHSMPTPISTEIVTQGEQPIAA
jgi:hypothetical protein